MSAFVIFIKIHDGILEEFLQRNRAEVIAVSIFEYDKEEEERKLRKAEFEAGEQSGIEKGIEKGRQQERQEIVQTLVENGMSVLEITNMLKLSEKDVLEMVKMK